jgi:serine/threonine protein kinase
MGLDKNQHLVYIIDFGLSKKYRNSKTGDHIPYKDGKSLTGTARYASIYTHLGIEQSRRDDLESLCYVMIYLMKGELPWQGQRAKSKKEKYQRIMEKKVATNIEDLCSNCPKQFIELLQYIRGLLFDQAPDYSFIYDTFDEISEMYGIDKNYQYDWHFKIEQEKAKEDLFRKSSKSSVNC